MIKFKLPQHFIDELHNLNLSELLDGDYITSNENVYKNMCDITFTGDELIIEDLNGNKLLIIVEDIYYGQKIAVTQDFRNKKGKINE